MALKLRYYGDPILRRPTEEVPLEKIRSTEFQAFLKELEETMHQEDGVGLAAPQVGSSARVCVACDGDQVYTLINPRIRGRSARMETDVEGCLSLPGLQAEVPRHYRVIVHALNPDGDPVVLQAKGLFARVLQHEIDHLDGVLYVDRADLSTLVWLQRRSDEEIEKLPTTLDEVKARFARELHGGKSLDELIFDPLREPVRSSQS